MARFSYWNDFKETVHEQGVTLSQLAAAAHVSVSTLKRHYDGREIDSDFDTHTLPKCSVSVRQKMKTKK